MSSGSSTIQRPCTSRDTDEHSTIETLDESNDNNNDNTNTIIIEGVNNTIKQHTKELHAPKNTDEQSTIMGLMITIIQELYHLEKP